MTLWVIKSKRQNHVHDQKAYLCRRQIRRVVYGKVVSGSMMYYQVHWTSKWSEVSLHGRASAHGAMCRRIDPSWWTHWAISRSSQCPTTGVVTKVGVSTILSVDGAYKRTLAANRKSSPCGSSWFLLSLFEWSFTISPTPYNRK